MHFPQITSISTQLHLLSDVLLVCSFSPSWSRPSVFATPKLSLKLLNLCLVLCGLCSKLLFHRSPLLYSVLGLGQLMASSLQLLLQPKVGLLLGSQAAIQVLRVLLLEPVHLHAHLVCRVTVGSHLSQSVLQALLGLCLLVTHDIDELGEFHGLSNIVILQGLQGVLQWLHCAQEFLVSLILMLPVLTGLAQLIQPPPVLVLLVLQGFLGRGKLLLQLADSSLKCRFLLGLGCSL
mmetsp:Transcript_38202/g.89647  ORF Transcript_38202/g.89647 Transcript_38202/m.89647 type:complete len:235 (+) Transcript_38202:1177-1881(+)